MKNLSDLQPIEETKRLSFEELKHSKEEEIQELRKKVLDLTKDMTLFEKIQHALFRWDLKQKILCLLEVGKINDSTAQGIRNEASSLPAKDTVLFNNIHRALHLLKSGEINDREKAKEIQYLKSLFKQSPEELAIAKRYLSHIEEMQQENIKNEVEEIIKTIWHIKEDILAYAFIKQTNQLGREVLGLINNNCKKDKYRSKDIISDALKILDIHCCPPPKEFCALIQSTHDRFEKDAQRREENRNPNQGSLLSEISESIQPKLNQKLQKKNIEQPNTIENAPTIKVTFPSAISDSKTLINKNTNDVISKSLAGEDLSSIKNNIFTIIRESVPHDRPNNKQEKNTSKQTSITEYSIYKFQHKAHNNNENEVDPKPLKGQHPSSITSELTKFDSFLTIETNLSEQSHTKIATILKETKYRAFELLINQQLLKWAQYQEQIDSLESEREKLKNPIKNESNDGLKAALKKIRDKKACLKQKQQIRIDAANYEEQIKLLNSDKSPKEIETIIKKTNKEIEEIWTTKRVLQLFKQIIDKKTLPFQNSEFLNKNFKRRTASKALVLEILNQLGVPEIYPLPLEILKLVLPNLDEEKQNLKPLAQETSQNILHMTAQSNQKPSEKFTFKEKQKALIIEEETSPLRQAGMFKNPSQPSKEVIDIVDSELNDSKNIHNKTDFLSEKPNKVITNLDHDPNFNEDTRKIRR